MDKINPALQHWGNINSQDIYLYHLQNANGIKVDITNFGATVTAITTPDRDGKFVDIAFGYDNLKGYINDNYYIGAIVGRYANRIAGGLVELDGKFHQLPVKKLAAQVTDAGSGRVLPVYTSEPAVHLYPDNTSGKDGAVYTRRSGFCLETQQYPDSPNQPHFPDTVLREGEVFKSKTIFEFGINK